MPRFLIEVPHQNSKEECERAVNIFKATGSHFLTNADWGCHDDVHKAWVVIEADTKDDALIVVPPWYRPKSVATNIEKLAFENIDNSVGKHQD